MNRIESLRRQIANGTYETPDKLRYVAARLIRDGLVEPHYDRPLAANDPEDWPELWTPEPKPDGMASQRERWAGYVCFYGALLIGAVLWVDAMLGASK